MEGTARLIRENLLGMKRRDIAEPAKLRASDIFRIEKAKKGYLGYPELRKILMARAESLGIEWSDSWFWDIDLLKQAIEKWGVNK